MAAIGQPQRKKPFSCAPVCVIFVWQKKGRQFMLNTTNYEIAIVSMASPASAASQSDRPASKFAWCCAVCVCVCRFACRSTFFATAAESASVLSLSEKCNLLVHAVHASHTPTYIVRVGVHAVRARALDSSSHSSTYRIEVPPSVRPAGPAGRAGRPGRPSACMQNAGVWPTRR